MAVAHSRKQGQNGREYGNTRPQQSRRAHRNHREQLTRKLPRAENETLVVRLRSTHVSRRVSLSSQFSLEDTAMVRCFLGGFVTVVVPFLGCCLRLGQEGSYEGQYVNGVRDGKGILTWPNGDR
jgi:hypothetical protein